MTLAAVKLGWTFAEAQQQGTSTFTALLGSATLARREMGALTTATHKTGLQLTTLTDAAERMQGFGFSTREINRNTLALGNYAQRAGLGAAGFSSLVDVFDRVKQKGSFSSLDVRALTAQSVPALQILRRELHLTAAQFLALQTGKLTIPARFALPALSAGLGARANLLGTNVQQQVGVAHSFLSQIFGTGEKQSFSFATRSLERINTLLERAAAGQKTGGMRGLLVGLDPSKQLLAGWSVLVAIGRDLAGAFRLIWTVGSFALGILVGFGGEAKRLGDQTGILGFALRNLGFVVKVLTALYILDRFWLVTLWASQKLFRGEIILSTAAVKLYELWVLRAEYATKIWAGAQWLLNFAMDANPLVAFVAGVVILSGALYLLAKRYQTVRDLLAQGVGLGKHDNPFVSGFLDALPGVGPLRQIVRTVHPQGLASGGSVFPGGVALVGEGGAPELLRNIGGVAHVAPVRAPRRARTVQPLHGGVGAGLAAMFAPVIDNTIVVDGVEFVRVVTKKKAANALLGEAVFGYVGDVRANA
jgi:hypothetical protein